MEYKTKDLNIATIMAYYGANLIRVEKDANLDSKAKFFIFSGNIDFEAIEKKYWEGELEVEPKRLLFILKEVKSRLYR